MRGGLSHHGLGAHVEFRLIWKKEKIEYRRENPEEFTSPRTLKACALAWVFPGLGHFFLGRRRRALILALTLTSAMVMGMVLGGDLYPLRGEGWIRAIGSFCQWGGGAVMLGARLFLERGTPISSSYDYGTIYFLIAGMVNWLCVVDAFDIAMNRK